MNQYTKAKKMSEQGQTERHEYDTELGEITAYDRECAKDLLDDLNEPGRPASAVEIVAQWFRKMRYEAVISDRGKSRASQAALVEALKASWELVKENAFALDDRSFLHQLKTSSAPTAAREFEVAQMVVAALAQSQERT